MSYVRYWRKITAGYYKYVYVQPIKTGYNFSFFSLQDTRANAKFHLFSSKLDLQAFNLSKPPEEFIIWKLSPY